MFSKVLLKSSLFLALFISLTFTQSCVYEVETPNVCFKEDVLPIFVNKCAITGCHNGSSNQGRIDLSNYNGIMKGIKAKHPAQSEYFTQITGGEMPPSGYSSLSKLEKSTIKNWIRMGAPNSSNCNVCDSTFTYSGRIKPLIDKWCVGCHAGAAAGGGYDLTNYDNIKKSTVNNRLLGSLQQLAGYSAMPKDAGKLSECDITAVQKWINAGTPDN